MSTLGTKAARRTGAQSLATLTDARKRRVLAALLDGSPPLSEENLAAAVAEREGQADQEAVRSVHLALHHKHLPALAEAELVAWDEADGTVAPADHPLLEDPQFESFLRTDGDRDAARSFVTDERRRAVLDVLDTRTGPVSRDTLAHEVAARDATGVPSDDAVEAVEVELHHRHLPKLADAGLVAYDPANERVERADRPAPVGELLADG